MSDPRIHKSQLIDTQPPIPGYRPGWFYFPCVAGGKEPALEGNWRKHASSDPAKLKAWLAAGYNLALDCGRSGVVVVDLDTDKETGATVGEAMWTRLQAEHGDVAGTYEAATPSGGAHLYFTGTAPSTVSKLAPKVDTRGEGGYVLVAPSVVDGRPYKVVDGDDVEPLPAWIGERLTARTEGKSAAPGVELDQPHNVERAIRWLQGRPPLAESEGADAGTLYAANVVMDFGLSAEEAAEVLIEHLRIEPRDQRFEAFVERKVANAERYRQNAVGAWAQPPHGERFGEAVAKLGEEAAARAVHDTKALSRVVGDEALAARIAALPDAERQVLLAYPSLRPLDYAARQAMPAPSFLIDHMLPDEGVTLIYGDEQSFKTFILLEWLLCLAAGVPVFGKYAVPAGGVETLLLSSEGPRGIARLREKAWYRAHPDVDPAALPFRLAPAVPKVVDKASVEAAIIWCKVFGYRPKVVAVDTYTSSTAGLSQNDETTVTAFKDMAHRFRDAFGAVTVVLHHPNKGGEEVRGSGAITADTDGRWFIKRPSRPGLVTVMKCEKLKDCDLSSLQSVVLQGEEVAFNPNAGDGGKSLVFKLATAAQAKAVTPRSEITGGQLGRVLVDMGADKRLGRDCRAANTEAVARMLAGPEVDDARVKAIADQLTDNSKPAGGGKSEGRFAPYVDVRGKGGKGGSTLWAYPGGAPLDPKAGDAFAGYGS